MRCSRGRVPSSPNRRHRNRAQRYAARLIDARPAPTPPATPDPAPSLACSLALAPPPEPDFAEVDIASLQLTRPRSVGVEAVGLAAIGWLGIDQILLDLGFNAAQRAAVAGSLIGRMARREVIAPRVAGCAGTTHWAN
jgi:hypothetical protein